MKTIHEKDCRCADCERAHVNGWYDRAYYKPTVQASPVEGVKYVRDPLIAPDAILPGPGGVFHIGSEVNLNVLVEEMNQRHVYGGGVKP